MFPLLLKRAYATAVGLSRQYGQGAVDLFEIHGAIYYVRGVQTARTVSRAGLLSLVLIVLMGAGLVILPLGLAMLIYSLSANWVATGVSLLVVGGLYVGAPLYVYRRCMSERAWMSLFKLDDLVARVTDKPAPGQSTEVARVMTNRS